MSYNFKIQVERETDGRWIAEIRALPGVMVYGKTRADAVRAVYALALRVLADRIEAGFASGAGGSRFCRGWRGA